MCYEYSARPPLPPIAGGAAHGEDLVLTAADGNKFMAYMARSGNADGAQIVIYPDVRGLHPFYKDLAIRFAEVGVSALAVDYFGRTAGTGARDEKFEFSPSVVDKPEVRVYKGSRGLLLSFPDLQGEFCRFPDVVGGEPSEPTPSTVANAHVKSRRCPAVRLVKGFDAGSELGHNC